MLFPCLQSHQFIIISVIGRKKTYWHVCKPDLYLICSSRVLYMLVLCIFYSAHASYQQDIYICSHHHQQAACGEAHRVYPAGRFPFAACCSRGMITMDERDDHGIALLIISICRYFSETIIVTIAVLASILMAATTYSLIASAALSIPSFPTPQVSSAGGRGRRVLPGDCASSLVPFLCIVLQWHQAVVGYCVIPQGC